MKRYKGRLIVAVLAVMCCAMVVGIKMWVRARIDVEKRVTYPKTLFVYETGEYVNEKFFYSMTMPEGYKATCVGPPAKDYGFYMYLDPSKQSYIYLLSGSDELPFDYSLNLCIKALKDTVGVTNVNIVKRKDTKLHNLPAINLATQYKKFGVPMVVEDFIVFRKGLPFEEFSYTFGLISTQANYAKHKIIFNKMKDSWKFHPLL